MDNILPLYSHASTYDLMFDGRQDVDFWTKRVLQYGGDCLEICCGTGRLLLELAAIGVEAHGLDYSQSMLDEAHKKAAERGLDAHLQSGDMRDFDFKRTFSSLLIVSNAFGHLYTLEDVQRHFTSVKRHMGMHSRYMVDMFVPRLDLLLEKCRRLMANFTDPADGHTVTVYEESRYDHAAQVKHNRWFYEKQGATQRIEVLPLRIYFPQELDALLTLSGFRIVEKLGDYDGSPFGDGAPHQLIICELQ
jgi:ubiquinone/menaquinone biosynthesis C-methylase UbiE